MNATPDNTLADPEQIIADLQRQLAEREAELVEAREQQTTPPTDDVIAELRQQLEELRAERDAALAGKVVLTEELAARTTALAQRNTEYRERIEHQAATIDVLKVMSASPGDPQPVFDLIVRQARDSAMARTRVFTSMME